MIEVGKYATLTIEKTVEFGVYLCEEAKTVTADEMHGDGGFGHGKHGSGDLAHGSAGAKNAAHVLLPKAQVPEGAKEGDSLRVFIYRDSKDRKIATTKEPRLTMGGIAPLTVREVTKVGGFLDWGLEKDLFLPYAEMVGRPRAGDKVLVRLYADKSDRLCASMKHIYDSLSTRSPYAIGDDVSGRIYEFGHDYGTFVAIDDKYSAMIPKHENVENLRIGDVVSARVTRVLEDGKLDISLREKSYIQMEDDAEAVMSLIEAYAGVLPFTEKASPEGIKRETGLSKAAFKRAIGRLYKERRIDLSDGKIRSTTEK